MEAKLEHLDGRVAELTRALRPASAEGEGRP